MRDTAFRRSGPDPNHVIGKGRIKAMWSGLRPASLAEISLLRIAVGNPALLMQLLNYPQTRNNAPVLKLSGNLFHTTTCVLVMTSVRILTAIKILSPSANRSERIRTPTSSSIFPWFLGQPAALLIQRTRVRIGHCRYHWMVGFSWRALKLDASWGCALRY